jgi:hypothetical protein
MLTQSKVAKGLPDRGDIHYWPSISDMVLPGKWLSQADMPNQIIRARTNSNHLLSMLPASILSEAGGTDI